MNDLHALNDVLQENAVHFIEADIRTKASDPGVVIMSHDAGDNGPTFESWISAMLSTNRYKEEGAKIGIKLDFKDAKCVAPALKTLVDASEDTGEADSTVWLNADIFVGPDGPPVSFEPESFIQTCLELYPKGVLSLGWTTHRLTGPAVLRDCMKRNCYMPCYFSKRKPVAYTKTMVLDMLEVCQKHRLTEVTFPVRASHVKESWDNLSLLLDYCPGYSLTIFSNSKWDGIGDMEWFNENVPRDRVFLDLLHASGGEGAKKRN